MYLRTLELAQVEEDEYFSHVISKDLTGILRDIRDTHRKDATTADENCVALDVQKQLQDAMDIRAPRKKRKPACSLPTSTLTTMHLPWSSLQI